jgi:hypothetical protein
MLPNRLKYKQQKGFTATGWAIILAIFGFFAYLAMILIPAAIANNTVDTVLKGLKDEPGITQKSKIQIWYLIEKKLYVNDIEYLKKEDFKLTKKDNNTLLITMDYEQRIEFAQKVYIVFERNKKVELVRN